MVSEFYWDGYLVQRKLLAGEDTWARVTHGKATAKTMEMISCDYIVG